MNFNQYALAQQLGMVCRQQGLRIALAESCTGGAVSEIVTMVPGSSKWFEASFVVYCNQAKTNLLGVDPKIIEQFGAVSDAVAKEMVKGALAHSTADLAVSITGIAGPHGGTEDKPVGTVWFGFADRKQGLFVTTKQSFQSGRAHIRQCAVQFAFSLFLQHLQAQA